MQRLLCWKSLPRPFSFHNNQYRVVLGRSGNTCGLTSTPITLTVDALPVANDPQDIEICDFDRNGFHNFNFDVEITPQILDGQSDTDFEILYFSSLSDAQNNIAGTNLNGSNYTNTTAFTLETIFARIQNRNNTNCGAIIDFTINVNDVASPNQPINLSPL